MRIRNYRNIPYDNPIEIDINKDITFIVGVNNVGKTNLLRMVLELRPVFEHKAANDFNEDHKQVGLVNHADSILNQHSIQHPLELRFSKSDACISVKVVPQGGEAHTNVFLASYSTQPTTSDSQRDALVTLKQEVLALFRKSSLVPTLRIASPYGSAQRKDILVGQDLLTQFGTRSVGDNVAYRYQIDLLIQELGELFGYKRFDLALAENKSTLIVKTDDGTFRLDELGEGIEHFIVVLSNVVFKQPSYVLIDEPEIGLHPRMQELFVRTLASKATHGLIASSHAIGLARSVADTIYSLSKDDQNRLYCSPFGQHHKSTIAQSIYEMGYSQFVELGGNHLLLVEGRTDIKSFREILRNYGIESKFIIWQLGGNTLICGDATKIADELNELRRMNAKSTSVIFDSERTAKGQALRKELESFKRTCEDLGFNVFATDYHSTENYICQRAIDVVLGTQYRALGPFEAFGARRGAQNWQKEKNWLLFREMKEQDFANTELDQFIRTTLVSASRS